MKKNILILAFFTAVIIFSSRFWPGINNRKTEFPSKLEVLDRPIKIAGNKTAESRIFGLSQTTLGRDYAVYLDLNLNGLCLNRGNAALITLEQTNHRTTANLGDYSRNCNSGFQTVIIPLTDFDGFKKSDPVTNIELSVFHPTDYQLDFNRLYFDRLPEDILGITNQKKNEEIYIPDKPLRSEPYARRNRP